jgi:predicted dehydrogenase
MAEIRVSHVPQNGRIQAHVSFPMDTIGIGLIGTGFMGKSHALAVGAVKATFGNLPRPLLEIVCDVDEQQTQLKAEEFGVRRWTTDWRSVVQDPKVDVVSITPPNRFHREMAIAALEAGKHVYCEKPMALTLTDSTAMAAAARRSGCVTLLGYGFAKNPALFNAKRLIEEERLEESSISVGLSTRTMSRTRTCLGPGGYGERKLAGNSRRPHMPSSVDCAYVDR